jgi:hypothetical protein
MKRMGNNKLWKHIARKHIVLMDITCIEKKYAKQIHKGKYRYAAN